jgi:hypothetical protein
MVIFLLKRKHSILLEGRHAHLPSPLSFLLRLLRRQPRREAELFLLSEISLVPPCESMTIHGRFTLATQIW